MIKRIVFFIIISVACFFSTYFLSIKYIENTSMPITFNLDNVYLFQVVSTIVCYSLTEILYKKKPRDIGFMFLFFTVVQFSLLFYVFRDSIFGEESLSKIEKAIFIIPVFLCLIIEVIAVMKLLSIQETKKINKE